jgi:aldose 1-epimerase
LIGERIIDGHEALTLSSDALGGIEAAFVPGAGMVGCSLRHRGEELLGQRGGLASYVAEHSTMGIPLLYPWANRVADKRFRVAGRELDLESDSPPPALDSNGLPIHGLLAAADGWSMEDHVGTDAGGVLLARFDFGRDESFCARFRFRTSCCSGSRCAAPSSR